MQNSACMELLCHSLSATPASRGSKSIDWIKTSSDLENQSRIISEIH